MKIYKYLLGFVVIIGLLSFLVIKVNADELDDINKQKQDKQSQKNQKEQLLKGVDYSIYSTSEALSYISQRITAIENLINEINTNKANIKNEIRVIEDEIIVVKAEYDREYNEYRDTVRVLYKAVGDTDLNTVFLSSGFEDLDNVVYFSYIQEGLYDTVAKLEEKLSYIDERQNRLAIDYEIMKESELDISQLNDELNVQKAQYQTYLLAQQAEKSKISSEIKSIDSEISSLDAKAQQIIASKYQGGTSGGGSATKPVKTDEGYFQIKVENSVDGTVKYDSYMKGPVKVSSINPLAVNGYLFKGTLEARGNTNVYLINELNIEDYIKGLGEMPSSWGANGGMEALKSQAIIGRSYAVANYYKRVGYNYNLLDTVDDQYYLGYGKVTSSYGNYWSDAVDQTAGVILNYNGTPVSAYYSSSASGHTLSSEEVWGGYRAWAQPVSDWIDPVNNVSYDTNGGSPYTYKYWGDGTGTVDTTLLEDLLNRGIYFDLYGINNSSSSVVTNYSTSDIVSLLGNNTIQNKVGTIQSLSVIYNNGSHTKDFTTRRATSLIITGTSGSYTMGADSFRYSYNIKSPGKLAIWSKKWDVLYEGGIWKFISMGYGHSVGLSQYGAYGRAKSGQNYGTILTHYYNGTTIGNTSTSQNIRIGLTKVPSSFYILCYGPGTINTGNGTIINIDNGDKIWVIEK